LSNAFIALYKALALLTEESIFPNFFSGESLHGFCELARRARRSKEQYKTKQYLSKMPVKKEIPFDHGHFFITFTSYNWLQLITITDGYDLIYNWFNILKTQGHFITGYLIMPNHVHATIAFRKTNKSINRIIGDGKRFIGYEIIKRRKEKRPE
jgi:hypothetical protein